MLTRLHADNDGPAWSCHCRSVPGGHSQRFPPTRCRTGWSAWYKQGVAKVTQAPGMDRLHRPRGAVSRRSARQWFL